MDSFDFMSSEHFRVILHPDKLHGLIFNRLDGSTATINHDDAKELSNLKKIDRIYGIVGRYLNKYLVVIKNRSLVGLLYDPGTRKEHEIYVITQVQAYDISCIATRNRELTSVKYDAKITRDEIESAEHNESALTHFPSQEDFSSLPVTISTSGYNSATSRSGPWNPFKLANSFKPKMPTQFLRSMAADSGAFGNGSGGCGTSQANSQTSEESDKRLVGEMIKLFNNTSSYYYSPTMDLTNRFSRNSTVKAPSHELLWKEADERFFWNKYMLKDLIELSERDHDANFFINVILQGFIAIKSQNLNQNPCSYNELRLKANNKLMNHDSNNQSDLVDSIHSYSEKGKSNKVGFKSCIQLALISRRSVFHAGARYRRRGCDDEGDCANFVETEQIFRYIQHFTSIVIIRGSIPLFWYQTGYNYRPPPVLCRNEAENHEAFMKHFLKLFESYGTDKVITIDCTEQSGREKCLHDAFKRHIDKLKAFHPNIEHIEFDFHKHCRGRQCTDLQVEKSLKACGLTDQIMKSIGYYWNDGDVVWNQSSLFRVNCLDCSDRTNVVQKALALRILDDQLTRLGVLAPDTSQEDNEFRKIMQVMWSTNGNVLSTQYCGTRALFTGERKLSGYLKDTYSSASRYYISKFRDVYRQAAIDAMLGVEPVSVNSSSVDQDDTAIEDQYELVSLDLLNDVIADK